MWLIYIIITIGVLYGIAAILKHNMDVKKDDEVRQTISQMFSNLPTEKRYEMLMASYQSLKSSLPLLEKNAQTIEQLAEVDRIKRNIKLILEECQKLEKLITNK